jgi:hypothetical protein
MRTPSFGNFLPSFCKDIGHFAVDRSMKGVFFYFGIAGQERIIRISELSDSPPDGEAEKMIGSSKCSENRTIDTTILDESTKNPLRMGGHVHERLRNGWGFVDVGFYRR